VACDVVLKSRSKIKRVSTLELQPSTQKVTLFKVDPLIFPYEAETLLTFVPVFYLNTSHTSHPHKIFRRNGVLHKGPTFRLAKLLARGVIIPRLVDFQTKIQSFGRTWEFVQPRENSILKNLSSFSPLVNCLPYLVI